MKMLLKREFLFNYKTGFLHLLLLQSYKVLYLWSGKCWIKQSCKLHPQLIERTRDSIPIKLVGEIDLLIVAFLSRLFFKFETSKSNYMRTSPSKLRWSEIRASNFLKNKHIKNIYF